MDFDIKITISQAHALSGWADDGDYATPVLLRTDELGNLYAAQGDARAVWTLAGKRDGNRSALNVGERLEAIRDYLDTPGYTNERRLSEIAAIASGEYPD